MKISRKLLLGFFEQIHSQTFQKTHSIGEYSFTRKRKLNFPLVFSMILKLVKKSLGIECEFMEPDINVIPPSKQAFSKARYKIRHTGFIELLELSLKIFYEGDPGIGLWKDYRVIGVDGSTIRLPSSEEVIGMFGKFDSEYGKTMPTVARVSLFVDLCTSMICSARLAPWGKGEQVLAEEQLPEVVNKMRLLGQEKLLFIYDRGYPSAKYIGQHIELGVDFVFRLQRNSYKHIWEKVYKGETDFYTEILDQSRNKAYKVRVVALRLPKGELEVLATSLSQETASIEELGQVYFLRCHIEECYKRLKVGAEIENFSGINLEAVFQEFWAHLVMCNVLSTHMCEADGAWDPTDLKEYRLNFSILFGVMREKLKQVLIGKCSPDEFQALFKRAAMRAKVKVRPGRSYSRDKVGKPKRHNIARRIC
jgi:hypothetical protein